MLNQEIRTVDIRTHFLCSIDIGRAIQIGSVGGEKRDDAEELWGASISWGDRTTE
jgi:hypothetical protein